jgi:hypothetical protein
MMRVYEYDRLLAEVDLIDGKLAITSFDGTAVTKLILESLRHFCGETLSDAELYVSLPMRLRGRTWAGVPPQEASLLEASRKFCEMRGGRGTG